jgi:mono/diheme cytochrome c family protein
MSGENPLEAAENCSQPMSGRVVASGRARPASLVGTRIGVLFCALIVVLFAMGAQNSPGVDKVHARPTIATMGRQTYMQYCACHGADARGNRPAALVLKTPPADLITLANRHGGQFPYDYVNDVLRLGARFVAHGSSDMPTWGPSLAQWTTMTRWRCESGSRLCATTWRLCSRRNRRQGNEAVT